MDTNVCGHCAGIDPATFNVIGEYSDHCAKSVKLFWVRSNQKAIYISLGARRNITEPRFVISLRLIEAAEFHYIAGSMIYQIFDVKESFLQLNSYVFFTFVEDCFMYVMGGCSMTLVCLGPLYGASLAPL
jgi:hypothetical protein